MKLLLARNPPHPGDREALSRLLEDNRSLSAILSLIFAAAYTWQTGPIVDPDMFREASRRLTARGWPWYFAADAEPSYRLADGTFLEPPS